MKEMIPIPIPDEIPEEIRELIGIVTHYTEDVRLDPEASDRVLNAADQIVIDYFVGRTVEEAFALLSALMRRGINLIQEFKKNGQFHNRPPLA